MHNATEFTILLTDNATIALAIVFVIYHILLIQFAPDIKKWIKEKTFKNKTDKIGFE